jgi:hypothetical protein
MKKTNVGKLVALCRERAGQSQPSVWDSGLFQQYNEEGLKISIKVNDHVSTEVFKAVICRSISHQHRNKPAGYPYQRW